MIVLIDMLYTPETGVCCRPTTLASRQILPGLAIKIDVRQAKLLISL
jgi:hypothetical protein